MQEGPPTRRPLVFPGPARSGWEGTPAAAVEPAFGIQAEVGDRRRRRDCANRVARQNRAVSRVYRVVVILAAAASLLLNFGIVDLIDGLTGAFTDDTAWVLDVGWGALFVS